MSREKRRITEHLWLIRADRCQAGAANQARRRRIRVRSTITVIPATSAEGATEQLTSVELCAEAGG